MPFRRGVREKNSGSAWAKVTMLAGKTYLQSRRYEPHIQSRKEESDASKNTDFKAHRWVVNSWLDESLSPGSDPTGIEDRKLRGHVAFCL